MDCTECPFKIKDTCSNVKSPRFDSVVVDRRGIGDYTYNSIACSLHPKAPKPVYETRTTGLTYTPKDDEEGWEIYGISQPAGLLIWTRVVRYTNE